MFKFLPLFAITYIDLIYEVRLMIKLTNVSKAYLLSQKEVELLKGEDYFYVGNSTATIITDINTIQVLTKRLFSIVGIALFIGILLKSIC